ncbi:MAG: NfeD family protein [Oscillospiraceae bacterium]|nr:NfeD family protein [Oscillospiraceae bacterium]
MRLIWAVLSAVFLGAEALSLGLVSIWFALGALCALLAEVFGAPPWLQIVLFIAVSAATLAMTRPLVKKFINGKTQATNADRALGMKAVAREDIDNLAGAGTVSLDGKIWSARSADGGTIPAGATVRVERIEGVKLIVRPDAAPAGSMAKQ